MWLASQVINKHYQVKKCQLDIAGHLYTYRLYKRHDIDNQRCILLLHGAGVAGVDTWSNIIAKLTQWQYVLLPDLRGMGETVSHCKGELAFSVEELVQDMHSLVAAQGWDSFDLAGYSLGALVSMLYKQRYSSQVRQQYLLEPGLFDCTDWNESKLLRAQYAQAVLDLRNNQGLIGVTNFLNTISPQRRILQKAEDIAIARLLKRQLGFANALQSVNDLALLLDREQLVLDQGNVVSIIGGLSVESMHQYHQLLAKKLPHWQYFSVKGCDHSLPYQKPRQIAAILNRMSVSSA
jgi:pimeloyl-ACP methyl ester carboxylesterase